MRRRNLSIGRPPTSADDGYYLARFNGTDEHLTVSGVTMTAPWSIAFGLILDSGASSYARIITKLARVHMLAATDGSEIWGGVLGDTSEYLYHRVLPASPTTTIHCAMSYDGGTVNSSVKLAVNGAGGSFFLNNAFAGQGSADEALEVGRHPSFNYRTKGDMAYLAIWSTAMNDTNLQALTAMGLDHDPRNNSGSYTAASSVIHYWDLGRINASGVVDLVGDYDLTPVNMDATNRVAP